ncbi:unnamed protein product [Periconia digitata]|uniref:Uncharacterized protein n=1 Tax=Periconia digitata TaxID=1303443 RepID=A0A9W4XI03_9PLEO|nr:unnamed protein product [Periconia digitata]
MSDFHRFPQRKEHHMPPNIRGEDESEIQMLTRLIEDLSYTLLSTSPPQPQSSTTSPSSSNTSSQHTSRRADPQSTTLCLVGRHPVPASAPTSSSSPDPDARFLAGVYRLHRSGLSKTLDYGPESGGSRVEALRRLLDVLEGEVGRGLERDKAVVMGKRGGKGGDEDGRIRAGFEERERERDRWGTAAGSGSSGGKKGLEGGRYF